MISELIPEAMVVKAFNTLIAATLDADPAVDNGKRVIFFSGDHPFAKETVGRIITDLGFGAVDLGDLKQGAPITEFAKALSTLPAGWPYPLSAPNAFMSISPPTSK